MKSNDHNSPRSPADTAIPPNSGDAELVERQPNGPKTVAIIQARLGSSRLPGKVLLDIAGQSMLERVVARVQRATNIDQVVIATTDQKSDLPLVEYCEDRAWNYFRGNEHDVLSRYVNAAREFSADRIVRITSDCPLIDSRVIDEVVELSTLVSNFDLDYCCNFYPARRYPRGLDCESISISALERIANRTRAREYREHVTLYAYRNPAEFTIGSLSCCDDHSELRWTVDTPRDLTLVRTIYRHFESIGDHEFGWRDVIAACQANPDWQKINQMVLQKAA